MSADAVQARDAAPPPPAIPEFAQVMGHPRPLWMLFMSEFWERFAFYGIRWAMVLYIVAQFHGGDAAGEKPAAELLGGVVPCGGLGGVADENGKLHLTVYIRFVLQYPVAVNILPAKLVVHGERTLPVIVVYLELAVIEP